MARKARIILPGYPHHITQRGNYKQKIFSSEDDYSCYLKWLQEYSKKYKLLLLSYCLMPNHVHFITVPENQTSCAMTFKITQMRYAHYYHSKNTLTGHLWQSRFYSCVLGQSHFYEAIRYVENRNLSPLSRPVF